MRPIRLILALTLFVGTTVGLAHPVRAQGSDDAATRAQARFRELDLNSSGWLSGREIEACGCRGFDEDGNGEITKAEFYQGFMLAAYQQTQTQGQATAPQQERAPTRQQPAAPAQAAGAGQEGFKIPDRVEVYYEGRWQPGTIVQVQGDRYQVSRDGDLVLQNLWATAASLRRLAPPRATAGLSSFKEGDVVEVEWHGTWYKSTVLEVRPEGYKINYIGWANTYDEVVGPARIRGTGGARRPAAGDGAAALTGEWFYASLTKADGSVINFAAAGTILELRADGTFMQNFATGSTARTVSGTYTLRGNRLTLAPENGEPTTFTAATSADGNTLTLRGDDGSAYRLTR
jgi:hypothetical protein